MNTKNLNYLEFKSLLGESKRNSDPIFCRYILRPLSFPIGWLFYITGMKANTISLVSILLTLVACNLILFGGGYQLILASSIMILVALTDCIDGNVARARKETGPSGEWMDALSGYTIYAFLPITLGIKLSSTGHDIFVDNLWIILGALTSIANLFMRLIYQKYINSIPVVDDVNAIKGVNSIFSRYSSEMGLVGWMMPVLFLTAVTDTLEFFLFFYFSFYTLSAILIVFVLFKRLSTQ